MKTTAIQKINKMGKISNIIARICKILIIIGIVFSLLGAAICLMVPETAVKFSISEIVVSEIDYGAMNIEVPESEKELAAKMNNGENTGTVRIDTVKGYVSGSRLEWSKDGKTLTPTEVTITDDVVKTEMVSESTSTTLRDTMAAMIMSAIFLTLTFITLCFLSSLCKAFRDCESPFEQKIIDKMQKLAIALIPWTIISSIGESIMNSLILGYQTEIFISIDMGVVLVVLIVLILVYIFKYGAVLQQESDETL